MWIETALQIFSPLMAVAGLLITLRMTRQVKKLMKALKNAGEMIDVMHDSLSCIAIQKNTIDPKIEALNALRQTSKIADKYLKE